MKSVNIRLLRIYSVPIRISSPELHVSDTCFLHEIHIVERYVTTTYRPHGIIYICALVGIRIIYVSVCMDNS